MILPTRKTVLLLLIPVAVLVVLPNAAGLTFAVVYDLAVLALVGLDVGLSVRPRHLEIARQLPARLSLDAWNPIQLELRNSGRRAARVQVTDDLPETFEASDLPMTVDLPAHRGVTVSYEVRPQQRGRFTFADLHVRWTTALKLARWQRRVAAEAEARVYPNVRNVRDHELAAQRSGMELGQMRMRQRGKGSIFESLRDYVPGDELTEIAWKATARRGRLTSRNYEADRSQNVLIVLDCGRLMANQVGRLSRLDHAINAAVMLTHVAVKQGDYIGLVAFSDQINASLPPVRGQRALSMMNETLYPLQPRPCESDYAGACRYLALQHRKRSLIVFFTDVIDKDASQVLMSYMGRFARHHLPLCVTLRDLDAEQAAAITPAEPEACFEQAVALELLDRRARALALMRQSGVDVLDVDPHALTPRLLDRYLALKQRQRL